MPDEVPADVGGEKRGFLDKFLHPVLAKITLTGMIGLKDILNGPGLRNRNKIHGFRKL
jgi:hypothetical protein